MVRLGKRVGFSPSLLALAALSFTLTVSCGRVFNDGSSVADSRASNLTDGTPGAGEQAAQGEKSTIKVSITTEGSVPSAGLNLAAGSLPQLKSARWLLQGCAIQKARDSIMKFRGQGNSTDAGDFGGLITGGIEIGLAGSADSGCVLSVESFDAVINGESITYVFDPYSPTARIFFGDGAAAPTVTGASDAGAQYYASPSRNDNLNVVNLRRLKPGLDPTLTTITEQSYVVVIVDKGASIIAKGLSEQGQGNMALLSVPVSVVQLKLKDMAKGGKANPARVEVVFSCLLPSAKQTLCDGVKAVFVVSSHAAGSGASLSRKDLEDQCTASTSGLIAIGATGFSGFSAPPVAFELKKGATSVANKDIDSSKQHYLILKYEGAGNNNAYKYYPVSFGSKKDYDDDHDD